MADTPNTVSTMNGLFKIVYGKLQNAIPDFAILQKLSEFNEADKTSLGNYFAQPVVLASEAGFSYLGDSGGVSTLNDAVAGASKEAQVKGSEIVLRSQLSYGALARASAQGEKAFRRASAFKVEDMNSSMRKRLEIAMLHGQKGIGTMGANVSGQVLTISDATWAPGIWVGSEGHIIDVYQSDLATVRQAGLVISAVDTDAKTITVTGTVTGIVTGDVIFFKGSNSAGTFNEMAGLAKILTNTGTLFNISAASYSLWKGTNVSSVGELTFAKLQEYVARAVNRGLMGPVTALVSPKLWAKLNSDMAALRVLDGSYSKAKAENGVEAIAFYGTNGKIDVVAHPFVKEGEAFILPLNSVKRVGSVDLTFNCPGIDGEAFFQYVSGKNAVELQCMADQAIFCEKPAICVYLSGITYA